MPFIKIAAPLLARFGKGKIAETARGQLQAIESLKTSLAAKSPTGPVIWFHVSSAGEFLQAKPVIESLKQKRPELFIALSFFSPSGMTWAKKFPQADFIGYCPIDTRVNIKTWLKLLKPCCLVMVKFDIWPNMVLESQVKGLSSFLISATLTKNSRRQKNLWTRGFFKKIYSAIEHIYCVGEEDQRLFLQSNPGHPDVKVLGDTRVDSVLDRQSKASHTNLNHHLKALQQAYSFILIVGSSWEADEKLLLPAWQQLRSNHPDALLILAPHEPNSKHLQETEQICKTLGLKTQLYSKYQLDNPGKIKAEVMIVDQVGILADLYRIGSGAFIGAGTGGVHNTMEPAAWGLPVIFRPVYHNSPEAIAMLNLGLFESVPDSNACHKILENWLVNSPKSKELGKKGREFLEKSQGATYKCSEAILTEIQ